MSFTKLFKDFSTEANLSIDDQKVSQFERFKDLLVSWNKKVNLTAIVDEKEIIIKHFLDCIIPASFFIEGKVIDVGTGAGFPSIPLTIVNPKLSIYGVDSLKKRVDFLKEVQNQLNLDINFSHGRAEDLARQTEFRERFDYATARAVASLNILLELNLPFIKVGGKFIVFKGANFEDELQNSSKALTLLGGELESVFTYTLPYNHEKRSLISN